MLIFVLLLLVATPAAAEDKCGEARPKDADVRVATDARLIKIFNRVVQKSGIDPAPTLCQASRTQRGQVPMVYLRSRVAIFPDRAVAEMTDVEMEGVIAHELGHYFLPLPQGSIGWLQYLAIESRTDAIGSRWVGIEPIIAAINSFRRFQVWESAEALAAYENEVAVRTRTLRQLKAEK